MTAKNMLCKIKLITCELDSTLEKKEYFKFRLNTQKMKLQLYFIIFLGRKIF